MKNLLQFIQAVMHRKPKSHEIKQAPHRVAKYYFKRGSKCSTKGAFGQCHQVVSNMTAMKANRKRLKTHVAIA